MFKTIWQLIWYPFRVWFWTYVSLGYEQDLHNHCGGYTYKKPNIVYRLYRLIDKDFRQECNKHMYRPLYRARHNVPKWSNRKNK